MKAVGKELKWVLCGFVGGFIICYVLIAAFNTPASRSLATVTNIAPQTAAPRIVIDLGHLNSSESHKIIPIDNARLKRGPFQRSPVLQNVPRGTLPDSYSVDLLDGRDLPPTGN